jgi:hypothetical protein
MILGIPKSEGGIVHRKLFYLALVTILILAFLAACGKSPQGSEIGASTSGKSQKPEVTATSTFQLTEKIVDQTPTIQRTEEIVAPTPTKEISVTETRVVKSCTNTNNPCECLGKSYEYNQALGEIKEEYIGSWHAAAFVGSGYAERFVLFPSGNYLFFPSQYECEFGNESCKPSPIEEGIWGIQDSHMNLAKDGDIKNVRSILIGGVIDASPDESPYPLKTTFDGTTYWLMSKDTNMWNPETGELCEGY